MNLVSLKTWHTHTHTHTHTLTHTLRQVCFVLTGWWSGAPVRGLHPEGESQVLPGCWRAGQSPVLPGAHIWGEGRRRSPTAWCPLMATARWNDVGCLAQPLYPNVQVFLIAVVSLTAFSSRCWSRRLFKGNCAGWKDALMRTRAPWKPGVHLIHVCSGPAKIQRSQPETCRKAAQRVIRAARTSAAFSRWAPFLRGSGTSERRCCQRWWVLMIVIPRD